MSDKKTITSIFFVPTLKIGREKLQNNDFFNAYVKDGIREVQYENSVYLVFKPKNTEKFHLFLQNERDRTSSLIDDYDYGNGYIVLVYKLNMKFANDFEKIKEGKYSKTSKEFQELFPKTVKVLVGGFRQDDISLQYRIFNKTEDLKKYWEDKLDVIFPEDIELWSVFDIEKETLTPEKLI
jgi:hypothetical protein